MGFALTLFEAAAEYVFDSRQLHDRLADLQEKRDSRQEWEDELQQAKEDAENVDPDEIARIEDEEPEALTDEEAAELEKLEELAGEVPEWEDGAGFIAREHWVEWVQEYARDMGFKDSNEWPARCVDWKRAARELEDDYASVMIEDFEFLYRSC